MFRFNALTKKGVIERLATRGLSKFQAYAELRPMVESQTKPMIFKANVGGHRVPKSMQEQLIELKNEIGRTYAILGRAESPKFDSPEVETPEFVEFQNPEMPEEIRDTETEEQDEEQDETPDTPQDEKPVAKGKRRIENELRRFLAEVRRIRKFCEDRAKLSEPVDSISMRPVQAAARLIPAGIPVEALLSSMAMHWNPDTRQDAGIPDFDYVAFSLRIMADRGITEIRRTSGKVETPHVLFGYALLLAENRQPIMLVGPAGTGKSHLAAQLADYLNLKYGETPMSPGATRGDLLGRHTIGGFISAEFVELYGGGGVFNFEEIDASDASMLIVLNNALAADRLYNSASGEMVEKHADFVAFSTANTFGLGANRDYTARERLDAATIDRWRMGRIFVALDENVEESMLGL